MKHYGIELLLILGLQSIEISKGSCFPNIFMFPRNPMLLIGKLVKKQHMLSCVSRIFIPNFLLYFEKSNPFLFVVYTGKMRTKLTL